MTHRTIASGLVATAREMQKKAAFIYPDNGWRTVTYEDFLRAAQGYALALRDVGVSNGARAALMAENRYEWCEAYLGILLAGGVAVPVDARLTPPEVRNILADSQAAAVIHSQDTHDTVAQAAEGLNIKFIGLESVGPSDEQVEPPPPEPGSLMALLYTSGTTGNPKAVMLTNENFLADADAVKEVGIITRRDLVLSILPLHHTYAFTCTLLVPLLFGGTVIYPEGLKGPQIKDAVLATGVTVLVGVPQLLELMRNRIMERMDSLPGPLARIMRLVIRLSGALRKKWDMNIMGLFFRPLGRQFRFFTSGGARLEPGVKDGLEALGFTVVEGYGLTESSPIVSFNPLKRRKAGSVGRAVKDTEFKIIDPDAEGVGEIAVRGPMVMQGYYNRPEETVKVLDAEGWFRTGDLGYLDPEGYLFITGRAKEVIVLPSGKNIYPEEVEKHYQQSPLISELCVFDDNGKLWAVIVPDMHEVKARRVANLNETIRWDIHTFSGHLPPHMRIKGYSLRTEPLPRTRLGKLRRFLVQKESAPAKAPEPIESDAALMEDPVGHAVVKSIRAFAGEDMPVRATDNMELDLGLDSLTRVELLVSLERELTLSLPEDEMAEVHTVAELIDAVKAHQGMGGVHAVYAEGRDPMDAVLFGEPSDEDKRGVGFDHSGSEWAASVMCFGLVKGVCKVLFRLKVDGTEHLPEPPFIVAPNHVSFLDGFFIGAALPLTSFKRFHSLGIKKYFSGGFGTWFARIAHVIPIDPEAHINRALGLSAYVLRNGQALLVFPEGGRSFDGRLMEFKKGIGILSKKLEVPVVPAYIDGAYRAWPRDVRLPRPATVSVQFGAPVRPQDITEAGDPYQALSDEVRRRVELLSQAKK